MFTYSENGELETKQNTVTSDIWSCEYDVMGNLVRVDLPNGDLVEYVIDGRNRRVGKKVNGNLVQGLLYGDQLNPVAELDGTGAVVARFVYGSRGHVPDYMVKGGTTYRIVSDYLGSVVAVVDIGTGTIAQQIEYDAWGRVLSDTNPGFQPFGFAAGIWDSEIGLVRFGARDYDPQTGRWTTKDPIHFKGGQANLQGYVGNDPVNFVDPLGLEAGRGFPLPDSTIHRLQPFFPDIDLRDVRVHHGRPSWHDWATDLGSFNARAFTFYNDVYFEDSSDFAQCIYGDPNRDPLLAHEFTHVLQYDLGGLATVLNYLYEFYSFGYEGNFYEQVADSAETHWNKNR